MRSMVKKSNSLKALTSVEIILSLSLFFILVLGLSGAIAYGLNVKKEVGEETKASFILEQSVEALSNIKDSDFLSLTNGTWGLIVNSGQWALTPNSDQQDGYVRQINISEVNENDKQAMITVNWTSGAGRIRSISSTMRLTNWERVIIVDYPVDWSNPIYAGVYNLVNTTGGFRVKLGSLKAYIFKQPDQEDFAVLDISSFPSVSQLGAFSLDGNNLPYDMHLEGNYIYATSEAQRRELHIIDVSVPTNPNIKKYFDLPGNADGTGIMEQNNNVYIGRLNNAALPEFYIVNVSNLDSPSITGSVNLGVNNVFDVFVSGNYAYLATSTNNAELTILDISNPAAPIFLSGLDLPTTTDGTRLAYYNGIVYLVQGTSMRIINVTNPSSPALLTTYEAGGSIGDLVIGLPQHPYIFLATSNASMEFQIVDVSNSLSPLIFGQFNTNSPLLGIDYDPVNELVGAVGNDTGGEFILISGKQFN